jgi:hypothetical protein
VSVKVLEDAIKKADLLFLNLSDDFKMDFCNRTKHYFLKNPNINSCHILELLLIADNEFSGKKLLDINAVLGKSPRWIFGFCHGYISKTKAFRSDDYSQGYIVGLNLNKYRK